MHALLRWLTDAALADSIVGDLTEQARSRGVLWYWRAITGIVIHAAWTRARQRLRAPRCGVGHVLRQATTSLRRRPGFSLAAVLLLALGIGANTAVFSVVRGVLLRPLPYADPDRVVFIWGDPVTVPGNRHAILSGEYVAGIARSEAPLDSFAVIEDWDTSAWANVDLVTPDGTERLRGASVTPNFFETLGAPAALGRAFSSKEDAKVAVISDALWRRHFGGDATIVGRTVPLATGTGSRREWLPFTIIGVLPRDFRFSYPRETEIYLPKAWRDIRFDDGFRYRAVARLRPGATAAQAQVVLTTVARRIVSGYRWQNPDSRDRFVGKAGMLVEPVTEHLQAEVRPGLLLLSGVAALVLLIACVNLGLLLLARTVDRRSELAVRAALGASRARVAGELAAESLLLAIAGAGLGVATAALLLPLVRSLMPPVVPRIDQIRMDPAVLGFAAALMIVTGLVAALGPASFVARRDLLASVRAAAAATTGDRGVIAVRRATLAVQVAIVMLLLVESGLLLRSLWRLQHVDLGFRADGTLTMEMFLIDRQYHRRPDRVVALATDVLARARGVPGVRRASVTTSVPMRDSEPTINVAPAGQQPRPGRLRSVDPDYFAIMHLRLRAGRLFSTDDITPVAVVSESYGRQFFGADSPVGRNLRIDDRDVRIVGAVSDVRYADPSRPSFPALYRPFSQEPTWRFSLIVEAQRGMESSVAAAIRTAVHEIDPRQPVEGLTTIDQLVSDSTAERRLYAVATAAFAAVALALAIAGVFSVVARTVTERRREIAIRVALGAERQRLVRLVYGYGLLPASVGIVAGLGLALAASRVLRRFLFEVAPTDLASYAGAAALVLVVTAAACYIPARRTLRVPPMMVLKSD